MTIKQDPKVIRKNAKTYKVTATPELMQQLATLSVAHTLEMFHVPATEQGMPSVDAIAASMHPLKVLLAEMASGKHVANRKVNPENINGISFTTLVSAGYFVVEFGEVVYDDAKNTIYRWGYRLSITDETGLPLVRKLLNVRDPNETESFTRLIDRL